MDSAPALQPPSIHRPLAEATAETSGLFERPEAGSLRTPSLPSIISGRATPPTSHLTDQPGVRGEILCKTPLARDSVLGGQRGELLREQRGVDAADACAACASAAVVVWRQRHPAAAACASSDTSAGRGRANHREKSARVNPAMACSARSNPLCCAVLAAVSATMSIPSATMSIPQNKVDPATGVLPPPGPLPKPPPSGAPLPPEVPQPASGPRVLGFGAHPHIARLAVNTLRSAGYRYDVLVTADTSEASDEKIVEALKAAPYDAVGIGGIVSMLHPEAERTPVSGKGALCWSEQ